MTTAHPSGGLETRRLAGNALGDAGFTLAEMLVSLAGASLLGGLLLAIVASQSRFHLHNEDAVMASRTIRALADGMAAEIRSAGPSDLLLATPDTVSLRFDVSRTVVCDTVGGATADLFAYDSVAATNLRTSWRGTAVLEPYAAEWLYADDFLPLSGVSSVAASACRAAGADPSSRHPGHAFRRTSGWDGPFGSPPSPGSLVRVYGSLTFAIRPSSSEPGTVSVRRDGQEFATHLEPGTRFEYRLANGMIQDRVAGADLPNVREVRVIGTALGRNGRGRGRTMAYAIRLHN